MEANTVREFLTLRKFFDLDVLKCWLLGVAAIATVEMGVTCEVMVRIVNFLAHPYASLNLPGDGSKHFARILKIEKVVGLRLSEMLVARCGCHCNC